MLNIKNRTRTVALWVDQHKISKTTPCKLVMDIAESTIGGGGKYLTDIGNQRHIQEQHKEHIQTNNLGPAPGAQLNASGARTSKSQQGGVEIVRRRGGEVPPIGEGAETEAKSDVLHPHGGGVRHPPPTNAKDPAKEDQGMPDDVGGPICPTKAN